MKKTNYKFGNHKCYAYMESAGHGWEVGFYFGGQRAFVGNFIHKQEATKWWAKMNKELTSFTRRFGVGEHASFTWYSKFCSHHLYKCYYAWLDGQFSKYQRGFEKACRQDEKKYREYKRKHHDGTVYTLRRAG